MTRFVRFCAFLSVLFFASNVFAAGYTCSTTKTYTSCSADYYLDSGTCTACPSSYPYSAGGTGGISSCYKNATKTGSQLDPSLPTGCAAQSTTACTPGTCTYKDYYSGTDGTCTPTNCTKTHSACTSASANYYLASGVAKACSSYSSSYPSSAGGNITSSSCYGSFSKSGSQNACSQPSNSVSYSCNTCTPGTCSYTKYASGTIKTDCTPTNCTQTVKSATCKANYYGTTSCTACSSFNSSYPYSDQGTTSSNYCYASKTNTGSQLACSQPSNSVSYTCGTCSPGTCSYRDYYNATDTTCTPTNCTKPVASATCKANYYGSTSCTACDSSYPYSDQGTTSSNYCYASKTNTGSQLACSQPSNSVSYTCGTCSPGTCTWRDYKNATDTTCTPTNCTKPVASATCKANYYGSTSCTACDSSYPYSDQGTTSSNYCYASKTNTGSQLACSQPANSSAYTCGTCSPGTCTWRDYKNATDTTCTPTNCTKPVASATCKAGYAGTTSCSACSGRTKYSAAGATSCSTVSTGYYTTGCNTSGNVCTGQSQCTSGTYCSGGVQNTCPSGYGASAAGSDAAADCYMSVAAAKYVKTANDASATACGTGTYKAAHTVYYGGTSTCNSCPSGYDDGAAASAESGCVISVAGGKYVGTKNSATLSTCSAGYYKAAHSVAYGSTSSCSACGAVNKYSSSGASSCSTVSTGYYTTGGTTTTRTGQSQCTSGTYCSGGVQNTCPSGYGASAAGSDAAADCYMSVAAAKYVKTANDASATACGTGTYKAAHTVYYGGTSTCNSCPSGYDDGAAASAESGCVISVAGGKYVGTKNSATLSTCAGGTYKAAHTVAYGSTSSCATCSAGYYCPEGASGQTACGGNTKYSSSGAASCSTVSSGYYTTGGTSTTRTGQTKCEAGNYCASGVKTACGGGKYSAAGATSCSNITAGCYGTSATSACPAVCGDNKYSNAGASSCSSCPTDYENSGTTAASHAGSASCIITVSGGYYIGTAGDNSSNWDKCAGGTYKASHTVAYGSTSSCATCSAGYYCPEGASGQTACGGNTKYSSSGAASCSTVSSGYYTTGGTSTTRTGQTKCEAGNYCASGVKTACGGGKYSAAGATSCSNITAGCYGTSASSSCPAVCAANTYSNAGASSCSSCPTDYKNSGDTAASHAGSASCIITVSGGYYIGTAGDNSGNWDKCAGGTYKASHTVAYGSTSSCTTCSAGYYCPEGASSQTACGGNTKFSSSGASSCSTVSSGYYSTGGTSTTRTGQTKCEAGNYCASGVKTACGGGKYSAAGATSCSNITAGCYGTSASSSCPAVCGDNKYSNAGASSCSSCPTDYENSGTTAASHAGSASCIITVSGGYYIGTAGDNSSNWDKCAGGTYKASHTVAYGSTSSCATCSAGYYCPEGASGQTACGGNTKFSSSGAASCSTVSSGYYSTGGTSTTRTGQTKCEAGNYCSGGVKTACGGGKYSAAGATSCSNITAGCYGTSATTACPAKCAAGKYSAAGAASCTDCGGGKYSSEGSSSCSNITAGCYGTSASSSCPAVCGDNKYSNAGASSCSSCPTDYENSGTTAASHAGSASCIITVSGGYYIGTAGDNSSNWDKCAGGTYKASHTVAYGSTSSCAACGGGKYSAAGSTSCTNISAGCYGTSASSACPAECAAGTYAPAGSASCSACTGRTKYSAKKAGSCSTVSGGYYTTGCNTSGNNCTGQSQCTSGTYCASGVSNNCPSGYGASAAGSDAAADCYMSVAAAKYVKTANDASATACGTGTYKAAHTVYYGGTSTCNSCPSGYDDGAAVATQAECIISVAGGKYVGTKNSATLTDCSAGYYKAAHSVAYGSTSSCSACGAVNKYSSSGASSCSTVSTGYYTTGGTTTTRTGQSQCTSGTYCTGGEQKTCPSGYGASASGSDAAADCYMSVAAAKYVKAANDASATACGTGTYKAAHTVYYGGTSSCSSCPSGYDDGAAVATQAECTISVAGGKYVGTKNSATLTDCSAGYYKGAHSVAYGSTSSCSACGAVNKYSSSGASSCSTVSTGYYTTGGTTTTRTGQSQCTSGTYCTGGEQKTCPSGYGASAAGSDAAADCYMSVAAAKYVKAANDASATACGTGTYKAAHTVYYGGTSTCSSCPTGYDDGAAASAESGCKISVAGGKYVGTKNSATLSDCASGTYKAAHSVEYGSTSSCGSCPATASGSDSGRDAATDCYVSCSAKSISNGTTTVVNAKEYYTGSAYPACTFNVNCNAKYGASGNKTTSPACTVCATGKYSAGGTAACSSCTNKPSNSSYTSNASSNACSWSCNDGYNKTADNQCGQFCGAGITHLHLGNGVSIPLYSSARTSPAINVKWNDTVCYGSLNSGKATGLNVKVGSTTYHAVN